MDQKNCIYCLEKKNETKFNREHLITDDLITFHDCKDVVINNCCEDCNSYFGGRIDRALNKKSLEAIAATKLGYKSGTIPTGSIISKGKKLGMRHVELDAEGKEIICKQLIFVRRDNDMPIRTYKYNEYITRKDEIIRDLYNADLYAWPSGYSEKKELSKATSYFEKLCPNIEFNVDRILEASKISGETYFEAMVRQTPDYWRSIAKTGFNFLSLSLKMQKNIFNEEFNQTRDFIRNSAEVPPFLLPEKNKTLASNTNIPQHCSFFKLDLEFVSISTVQIRYSQKLFGVERQIFLTPHFEPLILSRAYFKNGAPSISFCYDHKAKKKIQTLSTAIHIPKIIKPYVQT